MSRFSVSIVFAFITLVSLWSLTEACGDKFLVIGRGIRYERVHAAAHPGSILIYANRNIEDPKAGVNLEKALQKAGHKIQTVDSVSGLDATLKSAKFDLVLINLADTPLLEQQIVDSPSKPAVVPIIYNRTGKELATAGKQYACILKAADKNTDVLRVVDQAVGEKQSGAPVKCNWSK
jgi:hypothetical protein